MPFVSLTYAARRFGIQTFAKAKALMPELQEVELEYLDLRNWYVNQIARLDQYREALAQATTAADRREYGGKINAINSSLIDIKARVRQAGERSWAEAYHLAASHMLPREIDRQISEEADRLLGRPRHEIKDPNR